MKICIIGKNSYIGNHIDEWLSANGHEVFQLDVLTEDWERFDYSDLDVAIQVAGIVHRPECHDADLYKRVNTDMPVRIANIFKKSGTKHKTFVFLSTMAVYGSHKRLEKNVITANTGTSPSGLYGKSKKAAEDGLLVLQDTHFDVVVVRPPNVYGKGCKGGYIPGFVKIVKKLPVIPYAYNDVRQSMLYIDNLCEFIKLAIENNMHGIFMPQDDKAVSAIDIITAIADGLGKKARTSRFLGLGVYLCSFLPLIQKAYGGIEYDMALSKIQNMDYVVVPFNEAIKRTVK